MRAPEPLRLTSGAKINLFLRVIGRRSDGFHELESIFHSLDLADDMQVAPLSDGRIEVQMEAGSGAFVRLPDPDDNIVTEAARRLREFGSDGLGASIRIRKRIPVGGGLGGGSSNAAGALLALDRLWALDLGREVLLEVAAELGSDVPYALAGDGAALVGGRGESLARLPGPPQPLWFVLGISDDPLLTADVYAALGELPGDGPAAAPFALALGQGDVGELGQLLHNDLEPPAMALRPRLRDDKDVMVEAGARGACVSGSGPTIFGLVPDEATAGSVAEKVRGHFDRVAVAASAPSCITFV